MLKLTAVPVTLRDGCGCFGSSDVAFIELECDANGQPMATRENRERIRKVCEHYKIDEESSCR